jgi:hypothetical protein
MGDRTLRERPVRGKSETGARRIEMTCSWQALSEREGGDPWPAHFPCLTLELDYLIVQCSNAAMQHT